MVTASETIHAVLEFFKPVLRTIFFLKPLATFTQTFFETIDSSERGLIPVTMTIINHQKEYWPSSGSNK